MPVPTSPSPERIRDANVRYHDAAADEYDSKWGIDFGSVGQEQVRTKIERALGGWPRNGRPGKPPYAQALEIGAGTGYFGLNLLQLGLIESLTAIDVSEGMLGRLRRTAAELDLSVHTECSGAEHLPFADESFDLVFGHAVLHHIPDLPTALGEIRRVLRPGGTLVFCGEPSRYGDSLASLPKRGGTAFAPLWRRALGAGARSAAPAAEADGHELEPQVDVHAFAPADLRALLQRAGFGTVRVRGEELLSSLYGWWLRSLEGTAEPDEVPWSWRLFAFRSYLLVKRIDSALLEPSLPAALFYNLVLSARAPDR